MNRIIFPFPAYPLRGDVESNPGEDRVTVVGLENIAFDSSVALPNDNSVIQYDADLGRYVAGFTTGGFRGVRELSADYTLTEDDACFLFVVNSASLVTITLPSTAPDLSPAWWVMVENTGAGGVDIDPNGLDIDYAAGAVSLTTDQGLFIASNGTGYFTERGVGGGSGGGVTDITGDGALINNIASSGNVTLTLGNATKYQFWGRNSGTTGTPAYFNLPTSTFALATDGNGQVIAATRSGNTSTLATTSGSLTSGHLASFDGSGNIVDGGAAGGVTSFTGDGALLNNSASTGAVTATLGNATKYQFWGRNANSTGTPAYFNLPTSTFALATDSNGQVIAATRSGNTNTLATTSGVLTSTHIAVFDASGNIVDGGAPSGGSVTSVTGVAPIASSGGSTPAISLQNSAGVNVTAALGTDTKYFTASGSAASDNDIIIGDAQGGIKSNGGALPNGTTATTQAAGDATTKVATDAFVSAALKADTRYIPMSYIGTPGDSEEMLRVVMPANWVFPASFTTPTSIGTCDSNPTATVTLTVKFINSSGVLQATGTVSISTGGVFTFSLASPYTTSNKDQIAVFNQASHDATLSNPSLLFAFTRV